MKLNRTTPKYIFLRYLFASFGSALVMSIYAIVDSMCIGQYHGENGTAALAVVTPLWTIIYSCGLLFGIGGSTLMMSLRGKDKIKESNCFFTVSLIGASCLSILLWLALAIFQESLLITFGAKNKEVLNLALDYTLGMKLALPVFLATQLFAGFVRSDNNPLLATAAVIIGGLFNAFGDIFFVFDFGLGMGIKGAGLATMGGQFITVGILCIHFTLKKNTLTLEAPSHFFCKLRSVLIVGFSAFVLDITMGIFTIMFNNQIVCLNDGDTETATLAIYGVVCNVVALIQSFAYAVGQASQPLISESHGAGDKIKVKKYLRYSIISCAVISVISFILLEIFPLQILQLFIHIEDGSIITTIAPKLMRLYFLAFIFSITNIYFTYYFQSLLKARRAIIISILRGVLISGSLLYLLPFWLHSSSIWITMVITEGLTLIIILAWLLLDRKREIKRVSSTIRMQ